MALLGTAGFAQVYQLPDAGFDGDWKSVSQKPWLSTVTGSEPIGWHSFVTCTFSSKYTTGYAVREGLEKSTDVRTGASGSSCKLFSATVWGNLANGNLTTGRINAGSTTPTDASGNYNYSDPSATGYNQPFNGKPDVMTVWVKFAPAGNVTDYPYASVNAVIHNNNRYQDPEATDYTQIKVAQAQNAQITSNNKVWQELKLPFVYNTNNTTDATPYYILISFSTNAHPGSGTSGDALFVDDINFVYYSQLATLTYDGVGVTNFSEDGNTKTTAYTVNSTYDASKLAYTLKGTAQAADVAKSYNTTTGLLTITVSGNDISVNSTNVHTYYVQFIPQLTLDETSTSYTTANNTYSITLNRSLKSDSWNTLCLPFSLTSAEITTMFGSGAKVAKFTGMEGTSRMLFTTTDRAITAGEPCLITGTTTASSYAIGVKAITAATAGSVTQGSTTLQGTYSAGNVPQGAYFINSNKFYYADNANVTMKGFRAYVTTTSGGGAKAFDVSVDGQTTAVEGITTNTELTGAVYNLNGQQVRRGGSNAALPKGVYIQDGKKIVIR